MIHPFHLIYDNNVDTGIAIMQLVVVLYQYKYTSQSKKNDDCIKCQVITTEDSSSTNNNNKKGKDNKIVISTFAGNDLEDSKNSYDDRSAPVTDTAIDTAIDTATATTTATSTV
jgi:hypothetical protein